MTDFLDFEAESDNSDNEELEPHERRKLKKLKAMSDSDDDDEDDDEDDEDRLREELKDLIDDAPIEDDSDDDSGDGDDSDRSGTEKRKKSDDEDELDDRLEDDDYDLIEENLGVKVQRRKRFKRLKRNEDSDDGDEPVDQGAERESIANQLFDGDRDEEDEPDDEQRSSVHGPNESERFDDNDEDEESDADDFIVDDEGRPIADKKKRGKRVFNDAHLQEGQDIFGVDFDYDDFDKFEEDAYETEGEDEYEEDGIDGGEKERRPKKTTKQKAAKKSIFEIYEPSELKRGHFTDLDNEIRRTDVPERMQLREIPITSVPEESNELDDEADWIYRQAFLKPTISIQDNMGPDGRDRTRRPATTIGKIKQALDFMRNQQLEVPFIAFYRKEYVHPELSIADLWKVYHFDAKWCQLVSRRRTLMKLFKKMRDYQLDKAVANPVSLLQGDVRMMKEEDIDRLHYVQTPEELRDVHTHFLLHYTHDIQAMNEAYKIKEREKRRQERRRARRDTGEYLDTGSADETVNDPADEKREESVKQSRESGPYAMCRKAGILGIAKRFGLTPEQFAENLRDNYQRNEVEQETIELNDLAKEYVSPKFPTVEDVLHAAKFVVARQLSQDPALRKTVRETFYERAKLSVTPTKKGQKEIDENHSCYGMKYVKDKPVRDLAGEQFLRLCMAEEDKLITITISEKIDGNSSRASYLEEVKALYQRDEFSKTVQEWNALRAACVEEAINKMVFPDMRKELKSILLNEAKTAVLEACSRKLYNWLKVAPYTVDFSKEDDYDWHTTKGVRIMGFAYIPDEDQAAFCALTGADGEITDYLRVPNMLKRKSAHRSDERAMKEADLLALKNFIRHKKPHAIVIGGESCDALMIQQDFKELIQQLCEDEQFPRIAVDIVNNELAKIYAQSNKGNVDFREYPIVLRQAISLARRMQDPLVEYSQLCTADEEILCLRFHQLQDQLPKEQLLEHLYLEFVNRTNEVGVDVNLAVQNPLTLNLVQFICGLGPRKGHALIKLLKQTNQRLENRTQLVTACHMGPKVFINCSGFIKIDTNSLGDSTEAYVEVLDGSRVHPETYEWARKMAVDALEYDDDDANPAGALEEILESPERLKDLDLDAFAIELERQGFGNKSITLYDIRAELNARYKDMRAPFSPVTAEELFEILTKETPESLYVGKMILATVTGISRRKPKGDQLDQANPVRDDESALWQCPFCLTNDFPELSDVWNHFDAGSCPGQANGVKLQLENGLNGFIHIKNLSDKHVKNPDERVQVGQTIHVRVTKIDIKRFNVDCSSKSSDLSDRNHEWRPARDHYYDDDAERKDLRGDDQTKKSQNTRQQYFRRIIVHPAFHNKSYAEVIEIMATMDQGEVIVRPSSKASDHLTVTWKVADDIYQHIDVREEGKENTFSLGQSLWIGTEEFEDLDEIIARHINPMAAFARDLLAYKYYRDAAGGMKDKLEELLKEEKKKNPNKIHYFLSGSKNYPGQFLLSYFPIGKIRHEYCMVTPDGIRFRRQKFDSIHLFLKWFKEHYNEPIPGGGGGTVQTPRGTSSTSTRSTFATPSLTSNTQVIQKMAKTMPAHMLDSLTASVSQTPYTPGGFGLYINTPYTPSGQTPFMTPYHTPKYSMQTPIYSQPGTPSSSNGTFMPPPPTPNISGVRDDSFREYKSPNPFNARRQGGKYGGGNFESRERREGENNTSGGGERGGRGGYHHRGWRGGGGGRGRGRGYGGSSSQGNTYSRDDNFKHRSRDADNRDKSAPRNYSSKSTKGYKGENGGGAQPPQTEIIDWAQLKRANDATNATARGGDNSGNGGTPKESNRSHRYDDKRNDRPSSRQSDQHSRNDKNRRTDRNSRRDGSSRLTTMGDATPLYDEN